MKAVMKCHASAIAFSRSTTGGTRSLISMAQRTTDAEVGAPGNNCSAADTRQVCFFGMRKRIQMCSEVWTPADVDLCNCELCREISRGRSVSWRRQPC